MEEAKMKKSEADDEEKARALVKAVQDESKADVITYCGDINRLGADQLRAAVREEQRRENVLLCLTTYGGDPDAGYVIARCLQRNYKHFTVVVDGFCKSAGSLI